MHSIDLTITYIGTATAILDIDGIKFLTDPVFPEAGSEVRGKAAVLKTPEPAALGLKDLPHIDGVLLSHEDRPDNLDEVGRILLEGRKVITTRDGKKNLSSRPDVYGMEPWETRAFNFGGKKFTITATPCQHLPGGECIGFLIQAVSFGLGPNELPNAIYISGDTVYMEELKEISKRVNVVVAILNLGAAHVPMPHGRLQITMDGKQAAQLVRDIDADIVVPMHFESWSHFTENKDALAKSFNEEGISHKICWLVPGKAKEIL